MALAVKNWTYNAGDVRDKDWIPGSGRSPGGGHGNPLQYSCLENSMDRRTRQATVHRAAKSQTRLDKEMATHSSVLALRFPGTGEPGGLPSMGSHRVGHD